MAPKRPARAEMGSVVRTRRTLVQETVEVSVVRQKDATDLGEKKKVVVVEVEVQDKEAEKPPPPQVALNAVKGGEVAARQQPLPAAEEQQSAAGEEEESEEETQPIPLESEKSQGEEGKRVEEERRGSTEPRADGGFKGEIEPEAAAEDEEKKAVGGKIEEVKEGEVEKMGEEEKRRRRRRRRRMKTRAEAGGGITGGRGYKRYLFRVLKQVHPELRVSSMAMTVLNSLMKDMFERLLEEATRLSKYSGKATLSSREIQGAVRLVLPGELGKHAVAEGIKAVANYMAAEKAGA
ncbi:hypothetical protein Taro_016652 [Colocasia esculenta]|uniref:Core Histone H2A/H2B/H3 domain-containing protein n=1 Tax=Colocasia esculenta TaxID=4460 RepID=A0A843UQT4_COLES|nr:hypothetical protein [Colocasia esculenta]